MTSPRSFREAFTEDPADVKDRARIVGERDSARDWAVVLENRIEKALALHAARQFLRIPASSCDDPKLHCDAWFDDPWETYCPTCEATARFCPECTRVAQAADDDADAVNWPCPSVAALTGGGDEPEQERNEDHAGQRVCPVCCAVPVGDTVGCPCCEQWRNGIDTNGSWRVGGGDDARP